MSKKKQRFITNWLKAFIGARGESDQRKHTSGRGGVHWRTLDPTDGKKIMIASDLDHLTWIYTVKYPLQHKNTGLILKKKINR